MNVIIESEKDREEREKSYLSSFYRTNATMRTKTPDFGNVDVVLTDVSKQPAGQEKIEISKSKQ